MNETKTKTKNVKLRAFAITEKDPDISVPEKILMDLLLQKLEHGK